MASKAATLGDPRRPQEVKKVGSIQVPPVDDTVSSLILIAAMSAGVTGFMFQSKLLVWATIFLAMAAYVHQPYDAPNSTQLSVFVMTLAGWAAMNVYFRPWLMARQAQQSAQPAAAAAAAGDD